MPLTLHNLDQFNAYFHQDTIHPMVGVGDLSEADLGLFEPIDFGMYCVILMDSDFGELVINGTEISYRPGTMFTLRPGQVVSMNLKEDPHPRGKMLAFKPELIVNTGLGRDFYMFNFFEYKVFEALELTENERRIMLNCYANIHGELMSPDDELTSHMLRLGIGQMLSYCKRFYERQFDMRQLHSSDVVRKLDSLIDGYLSDGGQARQSGPPTVAWCSEQFHLAPKSFGALVKRELHMSAQQYIHNKIVERAKMMIAEPSASVNEVAEALGFAYPNHFTRFFHKCTGVTPRAFRQSLDNSRNTQPEKTAQL